MQRWVSVPSCARCRCKQVLPVELVQNFLQLNCILLFAVWQMGQNLSVTLSVHSSGRVVSMGKLQWQIAYQVIILFHFFLLPVCQLVFCSLASCRVLPLISPTEPMFGAKVMAVLFDLINCTTIPNIHRNKSCHSCTLAINSGSKLFSNSKNL